MRLKIASRKSDLARWQAVQVGRVLEQLPAKPSIEFNFKASLGDQNLDLPLASMGSKGVFTEDFYEDLIYGQCDLVVHSWKDLPTEARDETHIALTLPRADMRDMLLVPEAAWLNACKTGVLKVLTSSPRRVYNLSHALPALLPASLQLEFSNVRGNVPTRLQKMHHQGAALILAKAGLDRLLEAEAQGFVDGQVRKAIATCRFQVLPLSLNPNAPAQGALAVEVARQNMVLNNLCNSLSDATTFAAVTRERDVLKKYGGGCHQKIGVAVVPRDYGTVFSLRGVTDRGEILNEWHLENQTPWPIAISREHVFPLAAQDNSWFERQAVKPAIDLYSLPAVFIARADACPSDFLPMPTQKVWTAGVQSWQRLAQRGIWVNGCQDGLGESEPKNLDTMLEPLTWTKLSHDGADGIATYSLANKTTAPDLNGKTHFFWMSGTSFARAQELFPSEIANGHHACGPGATHDYLRRQNLRHPVKVFIGLPQFLRESLSPQVFRTEV